MSIVAGFQGQSVRHSVREKDLYLQRGCLRHLEWNEMAAKCFFEFHPCFAICDAEKGKSWRKKTHKPQSENQHHLFQCEILGALQAETNLVKNYTAC